MKNHLPLFGVGPWYVAIIVCMTFLAVIASNKGFCEFAKFPKLFPLFAVVGIILVYSGIKLWLRAVLFDKIDNNILENKLVTTGSYALVRNPIYSAFLLAFSGVICFTSNVVLFILPLFYWLFLTVLMKHTEEKWLHEQFGMEYDNYCKNVNRCLPNIFLV